MISPLVASGFSRKVFVASGFSRKVFVASGFSRKLAGVLLLVAIAHPVGAQPPAMERVTFDEAVRRAVERHPSVAAAAAQIVRADAALRLTRSTTRPTIDASITSTTLNRGVKFEEFTVTPQTQISSTVNLAMPLFAPADWARRMQAQDTRAIAELSVAEARRQIALAAADAYLSILARRRVVEANERARDVARAHYDFAHQQQVAGAGSLLNELRAQESLSSDEVLVESARLALYRAQEALGVLMAADGPVDAAEEPVFEIPADRPAEPGGAFLPFRSDLKLFAAREEAAGRAVRDSSKDYWPSLSGIFQTQTITPSPFFLPGKSWRALVIGTVPIFDSGRRAADRQTREAAQQEARATAAGGLTQARSEVRAAREAIQSAERALGSARAAADQARRVLEIVNVSVRAGAATNIEVIDAERRARDADTAAAVAEDALRRARLELLTGLGQFPK
ncbi:MAG: TolC family protein [Acidobacteria bacterium]|nr:TolC family protein [Acidobacteriota bacterium]